MRVVHRSRSPHQQVSLEAGRELVAAGSDQRAGRTRRILSLPPPLSVVTRSEPRYAVTPRSRPKSPRSRSGARVQRSAPSAVNFTNISRWPTRQPTDSVPPSAPQPGPATNDAPEVATVGLPELHRAAH